MLPATKLAHSAKCTNADDLFGAYILNCHLVSCMKKTISTCTLRHRVVAHSIPTRIIRSPITEVDWFVIGDGSVYPGRPYFQ